MSICALTLNQRSKKKSSANLAAANDQGSIQASQSTGLDPDADDEETEPLIDPQVLARLKFCQIGERRNWEGINVQYAGIPGNVSLNINERQLMFQPEMVRDSFTVDFFRVGRRI